MGLNKYNAEPTYIDRLTHEYSDKSNPYAIYFGSKLEARTYRALTRNENLLISRQHKILISKETKHFPASYWQCDFKVFPKNTRTEGASLPPLNIESKGLFFDTFQYKLQLLDSLKSEEIDNLILVVADGDYSLPRCYQSLNASNQVVNVSNLNNHLISLGY